MLVQSGEVLVPIFEVVARPTIRISDIKTRRFYIVDREQIKVREAVASEEDAKVLAGLVA